MGACYHSGFPGAAHRAGDEAAGVQPRRGFLHRMITRETLDNGIRLATETMGHVRSVSIGVWLTRGSRHETEPEGGIAHFIEHMLFKGTTTRSAEEIAQAVDSIARDNKDEADRVERERDEEVPTGGSTRT